MLHRWERRWRKGKMSIRHGAFKNRTSRRLSSLAPAVILCVVTAAAVWMLPDYWAERELRSQSRAVLKSVIEECHRVRPAFATLYEGYANPTCRIDVHALPRPDLSLTAYLNDRREVIVGALGADGASLIRSAALSSEGYDLMIGDRSSEIPIDREAMAFDGYYRPLREMCALVEVDLRIQECPF